MKLFYTIVTTAVFSFVLYACSSDSTKEQQNGEITSKKITVDWNANKDRIMRVIDRHFLENTLQKGVAEYEFLDKVNKGMPIFFALGIIEQDSLFPTSETTAFMKVNGRTPQGNSLVFDYEVVAKQAKEKADSTIYEVRSLNLRKKDQELRYFLRKEGDFWTKEILAIAQ